LDLLTQASSFLLCNILITGRERDPTFEASVAPVLGISMNIFGVLYDKR